MSNFTPITITAANAETVIRENIRMANAALKTKVHATRDGSLSANLNANNFRIQNVVADGTVDSFQACTLEAAQAIIALIP